MKRISKTLFIGVVILLQLAWGITALGSSTVQVFTDQTTFLSNTNAVQVPFPSSAEVLGNKPFGTGYLDYSCISGSTGISLAYGITIKEYTSPDWICYIGPAWNAPLTNTDPKPKNPTIVANGEDDYHVVEFDHPIYAVGFELLTNKYANETITLNFEDGSSQAFSDSVLDTATNTFEFVGFKSPKQITSIIIDTTGGATQNEGISAIWVYEDLTADLGDCSHGSYSGYELIETLFVTSYQSGSYSTPPIVSSSELVAGKEYLVEASGVFYAGGATKFDIRADAEYSNDRYQRINDLGWTDLVHSYEGYGEGLLELKLDGAIVEWGDTFNPDHVYTKTWSGTGSPLTLELQIYDIYASNNTGGLCVSIFELLNEPPVANDDTATTNEDTATNIDLLANDSDPDGDPLTAAIEVAPANGILGPISGGIVEYTPSANFCGTDSFVYSISDGKGGSDSATVTITVECINDPPIAVDDAYSTDEDISLIVVPVGVLENDSDVDGDALSSSIDTGTSHGILILNSDGSFAYAPDPDYCGQDNFTYTVFDGEGGSDSASVTLTIECVNDDPIITIDTPVVVVDEGDLAVNSGLVVDVDGDAITMSATKGTATKIDGTWVWSFLTTDGPTESDTITITADDGNGGISTVSFSLTVNNVAPAVDPITVDQNVIPVGTTIAASSAFSDPGTGDTHIAVWDWGDLSMDAQTPSPGPISASHTYAAPGIYTIALTVTDDDGGVGGVIYEFIVVYDPGDGFVTGGGWIDSPQGAYLPDPTLTGKASFGFVSKYKKGASVPTGNTEFQFKTAGLNFHSNSYEWLVVTGSNYARFKGSGTINGQGDYKFMIWAGDGSPDTFRIKIWEEDSLGNEIYIYDNGMDQALGGGSIVVHSK